MVVGAPRRAAAPAPACCLPAAAPAARLPMSKPDAMMLRWRSSCCLVRRAGARLCARPIRTLRRPVKVCFEDGRSELDAYSTQHTIDRSIHDRGLSKSVSGRHRASPRDGSLHTLCSAAPPPPNLPLPFHFLLLCSSLLCKCLPHDSECGRRITQSQAQEERRRAAPLRGVASFEWDGGGLFSSSNSRSRLVGPASR